MEVTLTAAFYLHFYMMVICIYREIYEVNVSFVGAIMKIMELVGVYLYFGLYIHCLSIYSFWMYDLPVKSYFEYFRHLDKH